MSGTITAASRRRMEVRDSFVDLTPGPYLTIEKDGLPVLDIRLQGAPDAEPVTERLLEALRVAFDFPGYKVVTRRTA